MSPCASSTTSPSFFFLFSFPEYKSLLLYWFYWFYITFFEKYSDLFRPVSLISLETWRIGAAKWSIQENELHASVPRSFPPIYDLPWQEKVLFGFFIKPIQPLSAHENFDASNLLISFILTETFLKECWFLRKTSPEVHEMYIYTFSTI